MTNRYPVLQHCWPLQEWQTGTQCYSTAGHYSNDKQVPSVTALLATTGMTNRYPVLQHCWPLQEWQTGTQCYSTAGHYRYNKQVPSVTALLATTGMTNRYPVLQHCWPLQQWQTGTQCYSTAGHYRNNKQVPSVTALLATTGMTNRYPVLQHCWPLEEWQTGTQCYSTLLTSKQYAVHTIRQCESTETFLKCYIQTISLFFKHCILIISGYISLKSMLSQSTDLCNGQLRYHLNIYTFDLSLNLPYIIIYITTMVSIILQTKLNYGDMPWTGKH